MRTTLTIDDDLMAALNSRARSSGQSIKNILNGLLRQALLPDPIRQADKIQLPTFAMGLKAGIDPTKFNQLDSELDDEHVVKKL